MQWGIGMSTNSLLQRIPFPLLYVLVVGTVGLVGWYTLEPIRVRPVPPTARVTAPSPPKETFRVVAVDTLLNVVCYKVEGDVSCVWIQSVSKVRKQLGLD